MSETPTESSPKFPSQAKWRAENPLARWAHVAVASAIRRGILKREQCAVCGAEPADFHHYPAHYYQPLRGRFLFRSHHKAEHRRLRQEGGGDG